MQRVCPCRATRTRWPRHGTRGSRRVPGAEFRLHLRGARLPGRTCRIWCMKRQRAPRYGGSPHSSRPRGTNGGLARNSEQKQKSRVFAARIPFHGTGSSQMTRRSAGRTAGKGSGTPNTAPPGHRPSGQNGRCAHRPLARPRHHHLACAASVLIPADAAEGARVPGRRLARTPRPRPRPSPPLFPLTCPTSRSSRRAPEPASRGRRHTPAPEKAEPASGRGRRGRGAQRGPEAAHPQTPLNSLKSQTK